MCAVLHLVLHLALSTCLRARGTHALKQVPDIFLSSGGLLPLAPTLQPLHIEPKMPFFNLGELQSLPNTVRLPKMELPLAGGPAWADAKGQTTPFASDLFKRVFGKRLKAQEDGEVYMVRHFVLSCMVMPRNTSTKLKT